MLELILNSDCFVAIYGVVTCAIMIWASQGEAAVNYANGRK